MGFLDNLSPEDRVEVKFTDFYKLVAGCTERDMVENAIMNDVPKKYIKCMLMESKEGDSK